MFPGSAVIKQMIGFWGKGCDTCLPFLAFLTFLLKMLSVVCLLSYNVSVIDNGEVDAASFFPPPRRHVRVSFVNFEAWQNTARVCQEEYLQAVFKKMYGRHVIHCGTFNSRETSRCWACLSLWQWEFTARRWDCNYTHQAKLYRVCSASWMWTLPTVQSVITTSALQAHHSGWHGNLVVPSALRRDVSGGQTDTCTQAHLLAERTMVDKSFNYSDWPKQPLPSGSLVSSLDDTQIHTAAHTLTHTCTLIQSLCISLPLILQNDRKQVSCFRAELPQNHSFTAQATVLPLAS